MKNKIKIFSIISISAITLSLVLGCKTDKDNTKYYNVKWTNYDGEVLSSTKVKEGSTPEYYLADPTRPADENYRYEFDKFEPTPSPIYKDTTFVATFRNIEKCEVVWYKEDGTKIKTDSTDIESIEYTGTVPAKSNVGDDYYYFDGWEFKEKPSNDKKILIATPIFKTCKKTDDRDYDGLVDHLDPTPTSASFKYSISFSLDDDSNLVTIKDADFNCDFKNMFVDADETIFNKDIAKLGAVLNNYTLINTEDVKPVDDKSLYDTIYKRFDCDNITYRSTVEDYASQTCDKNDQAKVELAHKLINVKDYEDKTAADDFRDFVFIKPVYNGGEYHKMEWMSNIDFGYAGEEYYSIEGEKHEQAWLDNPQYYKGVYVASSRIKPKIDEYISSYCTTGNKPILFITGHSRNASIANILGNMYNKDNKTKNFVYTFASLNTFFGDEDNTKVNKNIFNIVNTDDLVPLFPLSTWTENGKKIRRHGITKSISLGSSLKNKYKNRIGSDYAFVSGIGTTFNKYFGNLERKNLFVPSTEEKLTKKSSVSDYISLIHTMNPNVPEEQITKYFKFTEGNKLYVKTCVAGLLKFGIGLIPFMGGKLTDYDAGLELVSTYIPAAAELALNGLTDYPPAILPHYMTSYYIIADSL